MKKMYKVNTEGEYKNKELFILFSIVLWAGSESASYYFCLCLQVNFKGK